MLEDKGNLVDIEVLTLFYNEKYFSALKLAIVSFNNLLMHFEEEYRDFYINKIKDFMMPLMNQFKNNFIKVIMEFKDTMSKEKLKKFKFTMQ